MKQTATMLIAVFCIVCAALMVGCIESDAYYVQVPYQSPVYKTVVHTEPIYETVQNLELRDASVLGDEVYRINNVYNIEKEYTGSDTWGNSEYTFTVYYYDNNDAKRYGIYYQIDEWQSSTHNIIVGYDTWEEKVFDHYETLYRTEKRYAR